MAPRTHLGSLRRWLGQLADRIRRTSSAADWDARTRTFGRQAVLDLRHPDSAYTAVTDAQRRAILPHFHAALRGDERMVLDLGCGPGRFTPDLARLVAGRAIGVDPTQPLLDLAPRERGVAYLRSEGSHLPFASTSLDAVWVCLVLGGLRADALTRTVSEIERVLKQRGLLCLTENTTETRSPRHWTFRPIDTYRGMFRSVALRHESDYHDLDQRFSILVGRKLR